MFVGLFRSIEIGNVTFLQQHFGKMISLWRGDRTFAELEVKGLKVDRVIAEIYCSTVWSEVCKKCVASTKVQLAGVAARTWVDLYMSG